METPVTSLCSGPPTGINARMTGVMGSRAGTSAGPGGARPMTSVRAAGYTVRVALRDKLRRPNKQAPILQSGGRGGPGAGSSYQSQSAAAPVLLEKAEDSAEKQARDMETKVSCAARRSRWRPSQLSIRRSMCCLNHLLSLLWLVMLLWPWSELRRLAARSDSLPNSARQSG